MISRQHSDFAIVDTDPPGFAVDQVRNRPDLRNRPLLFASRALTPGQMEQLCARGTVTLVRRRALQRYELFLAPVPPVNPAFERAMARLSGKACLRSPAP